LLRRQGWEVLVGAPGGDEMLEAHRVDSVEGDGGDAVAAVAQAADTGELALGHAFRL
jgi:hypothetical protein